MRLRQYFFVAEALTNAAKHSAAACAEVLARIWVTVPYRFHLRWTRSRFPRRSRVRYGIELLSAAGSLAPLHAAPKVGARSEDHLALARAEGVPQA